MTPAEKGRDELSLTLTAACTQMIKDGVIKYAAWGVSQGNTKWHGFVEFDKLMTAHGIYKAWMIDSGFFEFSPCSVPKESARAEMLDLEHLVELGYASIPPRTPRMSRKKNSHAITEEVGVAAEDISTTLSKSPEISTTVAEEVVVHIVAKDVQVSTVAKEVIIPPIAEEIDIMIRDVKKIIVDEKPLLDKMIKIIDDMTPDALVSLLTRPVYAIFEVIPELMSSAFDFNTKKTPRNISETSIQAFQLAYTKAASLRLVNWKITYVYKDMLRIVNGFEKVRISKYTPTYTMILDDCDEDDFNDDGVEFDPKEHAEFALDTLLSMNLWA